MKKLKTLAICSIVLDQQMFSAIIFYFTSAFTMLVLGIAGSILSIAKWLNLPELKEVKESAGEQHD